MKISNCAATCAAVALPGAADRAELGLLVADLASTPLVQSRPLWQFHMVENYRRRARC